MFFAENGRESSLLAIVEWVKKATWKIFRKLVLFSTFLIFSRFIVSVNEIVSLENALYFPSSMMQSSTLKVNFDQLELALSDTNLIRN